MQVGSLFLELLSSAIWNRPANALLFEHADEKAWKEIIRYTGIQCVTALICDAVQTLPESCAPPRALKLTLLAQTGQTEDVNRILNRTITEVSREYNAEGLRFLLLKGQGNAGYYPVPLHRAPGDIDLFLYREDDYERAKQWIAEKGCTRKTETPLHTGYYWKGALIENHRRLRNYTREKYNLTLREILKTITDAEHFETAEFDGEKVHLLPVNFYAFYLFDHLFHHFIHGGVGVRQLCDWILLLDARHADIDRQWFTSTVKRFDQWKAMRAFAHTAVKHLGADPAIFPFDIGKNGRYSDKIINDILAGGIFGFYRYDKKNQETWTGKWKRRIDSTMRYIVFGPVAPRYIYILFRKRLGRVIKNLYKKR